MAIYSENGYTLNLIRLTLSKLPSYPDPYSIAAQVDMEITTPIGGNVDYLLIQLETGSINYSITDGGSAGHIVNIPENSDAVPITINAVVSNEIETEQIESLLGDIYFEQGVYPDGTSYFFADDLAFDEIINNLNAVPGNTGYKAWTILEQYRSDTGQTTGQTKANDPEDPDYIAPIYDINFCPLP